MVAELTGQPDENPDQAAGRAAMAAAEAVRSARRGDDHPMKSATTRTEALLYLRVSTKRQANMGGQLEGFSLPAQREAATRKAETLDATVADEYVDRGESARSANRPALQEMLTDIRNGVHPGVRYLIVHKIDRWTRERADDIAINAELRAAGIQLVSCSEFFDDTPSGQLNYGIQAEMAQYYSRNLAQEVLKGTTQKAKVGGTPYRAPVGYLNERTFNEGRDHRFITVDPERAPLVTWCFEQYATGEWTAVNLLAEATEKGLRSRPTPKRPAKPITVTGFLYLLKNPYYMGLVRYRGALYPGQHPALVTPELWLQVQDVLATHDKSGEKTREHPHYLKGSVYCASCGSRLVFSRSKGNGGSYDYFFCLGRQQHTAGRKKAPATDDGVVAARCTQPYIRTDIIEAAVENYYETFRLSEQRAQAIRMAVATELEHETTDAAQEVTRQEQTLIRLDHERQKLLQAHYADAIPLDLMKAEMARLTRETSIAERRLEAAQTKWGDIQATLDKALDLAGSCHQHYQQAPDKIRRQLNQGFFKKLYTGRDGEVARVELTDAFSLLLADDLLDRIEAERANGTSYERAAPKDDWARPESFNDKRPDPLGPDPFVLDVADVHGSNIKTMVDLWGRLSNLSEILERVSDQGWSRPARPSGTVTGPVGRPDSDPAGTWPEQKGRLSNPVQRRLSDADSGALCDLYSEGRSIDSLAREYRVNRTTIITHLDRAGIERRRAARQMTDDSVARAATRYGRGASLAVVAKEFDVHARTLAREFRQARVSIRPRHGC